MAIITKYFSTATEISASAPSSNLSGDNWDNRAPLFDGSNTWSSVITDFDFSGSNSLLCLIGPGTYTCAETLDGTAITTDPTSANQLTLHGCDSSGNQLSPPDPTWISCKPSWSSSSLPVIATSGNIRTIGNVPTINARLIYFSATGRGGDVLWGPGAVDWCYVKNSASGGTCCSGGRITNCVLECSNANFDRICYVLNPIANCRLIGNASATSGGRRGIDINSTSQTSSIQNCTIVNCAVAGIEFTANSSAYVNVISRCTIVGCGDGIKLNSTANGSVIPITNCMIVGNSGCGVNTQLNGRAWVSGCRFRDNISGPVSAYGNLPDTFDNLTTDSDDATEFVDAANGDYRIKATSAIWGKGYGAGDEIPTPESIAAAVWVRNGRSLST